LGRGHCWDWLGFSGGERQQAALKKATKPLFNKALWLFSVLSDSLLNACVVRVAGIGNPASMRLSGHLGENLGSGN
jgi:hypothetical protein